MLLIHSVQGTPAIIVLCTLLFVDETVVPVPLLPNELILLSAGILVAAGKLTVWVVVPAAFVAMTAGTLVGFSWARLIGHYRVSTLVRRLHAEAGYERVRARQEAAGAVGIAVTRLLPGVRPLATLYCGAAGVNLRSFLLGALPAQLLWEVFWIALGGVVGVPAARFLNEFEHLLFSFVLLLVLAAIAHGTLLHLRVRGTSAAASGAKRSLSSPSSPAGLTCETLSVDKVVN
jgi:membrane protein DedA with SNARE-associated domain